LAEKLTAPQPVVAWSAPPRAAKAPVAPPTVADLVARKKSERENVERALALAELGEFSVPMQLLACARQV
jgi:hypothetical protein